jgi:hypothetical protein
MVEEEVGVMVKRLFAMAEQRESDYAIGRAALEMIEKAMDIIIDREMTNPDDHAVAGKEPLF